MKLNLAGGNKPLEGYINVDFFAENPDHRADLFKFPWPWADKSVDAVAMFHFLEHVEDLDKTLREVHRILKPGGEFWVVVPHQKNPCAFDPAHNYFFSSATFKHIAEHSYYRYGGKQLFKTTYFKMPLLDKCWTPSDILSNNFPIFFEKFIPFAPAHIEWKGIAV